MKKIDSTAVGMGYALHGMAQRGYFPSTVFDVGASDGSWTRHASQFWPEAQFVLFEPLAERRQALDEFQRKNPVKTQIHFVGLGDEEAELSLGVTEGLWESSFAYKGATERKARVRRLDNMFREGIIPSPRFMKIDVQGFERRVLRGAGDLISDLEGVLMECPFFSFCEEMVTLDQTVAFMSSYGFVPYEFMDFLRRPLDGAMGQCDIVFLKRDHALLANHSWN